MTWNPASGTVDKPKPKYVVSERCHMLRQQLRRVQWEIRTTEVSRERMGSRTGRKQQRNEDFTDLTDYIITMIEELGGHRQPQVVENVHPLVKRARRMAERGTTEDEEFDPYTTA